jgi:hypothetical protein
MMMIAREPLAKSEVEIIMATVATVLVSASRMVSGEVMPNFEAIAEQNEMSFAQKRKDVALCKHCSQVKMPLRRRSKKPPRRFAICNRFQK